MTCQIVAHYWVTKLGRLLNVCVQCRDELTDLFGWTIRNTPYA